MKYLISSILGIILGQLAYHLIRVLPPILEDKDALKKFLKTLNQKIKIDYKYSIILIVIFNILAYFSTINITFYIFVILIFTLLIVFVIDIKYQLIPDTTQIIILTLGILVTALDYTNFLHHIVGAIIGGGSFFLIGVLGKLIYKKEGMGFGDVKLMAGLGLIFGIKEVLVITVLAFFIAAISSIFLIVIKTKKIDSYIPFGPFIVISVILVIFFEPQVFINTYIAFCSKLGMWITENIFKIIY